MAKYDNRARLLIAGLIRSSGKNGGRPTLTAADGDLLRQYCARILVDRWALEEHIRLLFKSRDRAAEQPDLLPEEQMEEALARGLSNLDDETFAGLILNPVALHGLADAIDERMPEAWLGEMEAEGNSLIKADGRSLARCQQVLDRAKERANPGVRPKDRTDRSGA